MATRPQRHSSGLPKARSNYDRQRRTTDPALRRAKRIRSSAAWQRVQRSVLNRNPLCCDPLGQHAEAKRIEPSTQVHHILPLATHPDLAFDRDNLAAVCTGCHAEIEGRERRGQGTSELFKVGLIETDNISRQLFADGSQDAPVFSEAGQGVRRGIKRQ